LVFEYVLSVIATDENDGEVGTFLADQRRSVETAAIAQGDINQSELNFV
jgi:hypothetical protein